MHGDLQRHTYPESAESNSYENPTCLKPEKVKLNSSYALIVGFSDTHIFFFQSFFKSTRFTEHKICITTKSVDKDTIDY